MYKSIGEKYGVKHSEDEILMRYRRAYEQPWGGSRLRCEFLMLKYAIYWQFVLLCSDAVMHVSLCRNFWLCHTALFPVCVLFWLDLVTFCWCDAS